MERQGRVFISSRGRTTAFRVIGPAGMVESVPLRQAAEQALDRGATSLLVDLRECAWMDSTFLGMLLVLARRAERIGQGAHVFLVSPSPECQLVLEQTGVDEILGVVSAPDLSQQEWTELLGPTEAEALRRDVLSAHQQLARLPGEAGGEFRQVERALTDEARR